MSENGGVPLSYGFITHGKRPEILELAIRSIVRQAAPGSEILVAGNYREDERLRYLPETELAQEGRLGAMRNRLVEAARHDHIVILDDDILLAPGWLDQFSSLNEPYDILTSRIRLPDGTRSWDHATFSGARGAILLPEGAEGDSGTYMSGGSAWVMHRRVFEKVRWNENLRFNESEDVEFSLHCKMAGFHVRHHELCLAYHLDPRYTRFGDTILLKSKDCPSGWLLGRQELKDPHDLFRLFRDRLQAIEIGEAMDCLRAGALLYPEHSALSQSWESANRKAGESRFGDRWYLGGDPYLHQYILQLRDALPEDPEREAAEEQLVTLLQVAGESSEKVVEFFQRQGARLHRRLPAISSLCLEEARNEGEKEMVKILESCTGLLRSALADPPTKALEDPRLLPLLSL